MRRLCKAFIPVALIAWASLAHAERMMVETEGVYYGGQRESPEQVLERARQDAVEQAVERLVGVYLRSVTEIRNVRVVRRDLMSWAEGLVHVEVLTPREEQMAHYHATQREGRVRIRAWAEREDLDRHRADLVRMASRFAEGAGPDASGDPVGAALFRAVRDLAVGLPARTDGRLWWRVSIDTILNADYHLPAQLSRHLYRRLELPGGRYFTLIPRDAEVVRRALREINFSMGDAFDSDTRVEAGHFAGCEALLRGSYQAFEKQVFLYLKLVSLRTLSDLAHAEAIIRREDLPGGISVEPDVSAADRRKVREFSITPAPVDTSFRIEVWPDQGDGATYREGDRFYVRFRASRDCYVRLYHTNPAGEIRYLYPKPPWEQKRIRAGVVYTIPDSGYGRVWFVKAPYGLDIIKAVASTVPFTDRPETALAGTYAPGGARGVLMRGLGETSLSAEATCVFRTVGR